MNDGIGVLIVVAVFVALMLSGSLLRSRGCHPELTRKLLHVGMGVTALLFPLLFTGSTPVLVLCGGFLVVLLLLRRFPTLRVASCVMGDVARNSYGEFYFAASVGLLFLLNGGGGLAYVIPLLILTFADTASALIGVRLGRHRYQVVEGFKSWEGSAAFAIAAFGCVWLPLTLWSPTSQLWNVLVATCIALLTMLLESCSWRGNDNLLLPIAAFLMLRIYDGESVPGLLERIAVLSFLGVLFLWVRARLTSGDGILLGVLFVAYLIWAFCGWGWLTLLLTVLAAPYILTHTRTPGASHSIPLRLSVPPLIGFLGVSIHVFTERFLFIRL